MKRTNCWIVGAVAAMFSCVAIAANADDMSTTTTGTGMTLGTGTMSTNGSGAMGTGMIDYTALNSPYYDYTDLKQAKSRGYSDKEVATMAKIAEKSGWSFNDIVAKVQNGTTFAQLADASNMRLADVYDSSDEQAKIANYEAAYEATGWGAWNGNSGMANSMSMPMTSDTTMTTNTMPATSSMSDTSMSDKDVATIIQHNRRLSTLAKALQSADLISTLQGPGPFTIFAPDNNAFKHLPKGALNSLMANTDSLKKVLTYHVIPARVDAATAMSMTSPTSPATVEGGTLQVTTSNGMVMINNAKVVKADIIASNGIIHIIDTVLMPADMPATTTP